MRNFSVALCLATLLTPCALLTGCGSDAGPSLLVQKNVNGAYTFTAGGSPTDATLFTANLTSGNPVDNSGANYYSVVTGTITNGVGVDLSGCNGKAVPITGKITNPDGNNVFINMTGSTDGGGTLMLTGSITGSQDLGSFFAGTIEIDGGSCPTSAMTYQARR